jgi:hypothetical protein
MVRLLYFSQYLNLGTLGFEQLDWKLCKLLPAKQCLQISNCMSHINDRRMSCSCINWALTTLKLLFILTVLEELINLIIQSITNGSIGLSSDL